MSPVLGGGGGVPDAIKKWVNNRISQAIPNWLDTLANAEVFGYKLTDNPVAFVAASVISWWLELLFGLLSKVEASLFAAGESGSQAIRSSGTAILESFGPPGDAAIAVLQNLDSNLYAFAYATGPGAWLMVPLVWIATALAFYALVGALSRLFRRVIV